VSSLVSGDAAPAFDLPALGGGKVAGPAKSGLTWLVVYKHSCPTCRWALPYYQALHEKAGGGSLRVVGVAEGSPEETEAQAAELGVTFPVGLEADPYPVSASYDLSTVPTCFLIDAEGRVELTSIGFSRDDLQEAARRAAEVDGGEPADLFGGEEVPAFRPG
jgi:peroxiredoxin